MAKESKKAAVAGQIKPGNTPLKISFILILLAYGFVTILTPNLKTLDSNGSKFLFLSLLNLLTFLYLFTGKEFKARPELVLKFFTNRIGFIYLLLMLVSLLSFVKAINLLESILHFAKIFTVFSAAYFVSVILFSDKRYVFYLAVGLSVMLIFDCVSVFTHILKYINRQIDTIGQIKSVYSNKNILAAAVFVKIPFALWLLVFHKGWIKKLGFVALFFGLFATLLMSTRSFYLGTVLLTVLFVLYCIVRYRSNGDKVNLRLLFLFISALGIAFLVFIGTQKFLYPKNNDLYNNDIAARIASISAKETSAGLRLAAWKRSYLLIKSDPILGVGLGNWKLVSLKYENLTNPAYIYQYKAHNDFIETTAETGIAGGILFVLIFLFIGGNFLILLFKKGENEALKYMFLPAFGLVCYLFDAFFNFPQDRPEISALFALFVGSGTAFSVWAKSGSTVTTESKATAYPRFLNRLISNLVKSGNSAKNIRTTVPFRSMQFIFPLILLASSYVLLQNFYSLKLQRIVQEEVTGGKLIHNSGLFLSDFPSIPDISVVGEPISVNKARYLINEAKYNEAIRLLIPDKSSPYDTRPEYFISMAYYNLGNLDSSLFYAQKVYRQKPRMFKNVALMCNTLDRKGRTAEAKRILDNYLADFKTDSEAWLFASSMFDKSGDSRHAASLIDTAVKYLPADSNIRKQQKYLVRKLEIGSFQTQYDAAMKAYKTQKYSDAVALFSQIIAKDNRFLEGYEYRAFSYYMMKDYQRSLNDVNYMFKNGVTRANLYNLRGVNHFSLGKKEEACLDFKASMDLGDRDGLTNFTKFCQPAPK